jgi:hypothetical protein
MTLKFTLLPLIAATVFSFSQKETTSSSTLANNVTPVVTKVPGTPTSTNMVTSTGSVLGSVTVVADQDLGTLTVTYQMNAGWSLQQANLHTGTIANIPLNCNGDPRPNRFANRKSFATGGCTANSGGSNVSTTTFTIPLAGLPTDEITVAAMAKVVNSSGQVSTVWGQGVEINDDGSWAMRFSYILDVR